MTLIDFVNKYIKKGVDYDGVYGKQCVDLFRQYCKDVLNVPHTGAVEGAKDLYLNYKNLKKEQKYFMKLKIDGLGTMAKAGDVAVWDCTKTNPFGHVAIVIASSPHKLIVFEQDGYDQSKGAYLAERSDKNLLGVLRRWPEEI